MEVEKEVKALKRILNTNSKRETVEDDLKTPGEKEIWSRFAEERREWRRLIGKTEAY